MDKHGWLLVADFNNNTIRKVSPAGAVTTVAGNGESGFADGEGIVRVCMCACVCVLCVCVCVHV